MMSMPLHRRVLRAGPDVAIMVLLTLFVWGIYPFSRGIRFAGDDVNFLFVAWQQLGNPLTQQIATKYGADGWTRALAFWPFVLATNLPAPTVFLQVFYGCVWFLNGLAVASLARVLSPQSRLAPLIAGCLMVTATSDFMTGSIVYGPHLLGIGLFFFGVAQLLRSAEITGRPHNVIAAACLLTYSFFTVEYTYAAVPLLPALIYLHVRSIWRWHSLRALGVLAVSFVPPAAILVRALLGPGSYATQVLTVRAPFTDWLSMFASHVGHNFWPVSWAFRRIPPWYDNYGPAFPLVLFVGLAGLGALLVGWRYQVRARAEVDVKATSWIRAGLLVALAIAAAAAVNAVSTNPGGEFYVRSHFVSRGWASLALAILLARMAHVRSLRLIAGAVFSVIVFFGVWGGVERQSYLLGYGQSERRELLSLQDAVPGLDPSAQVVLIQPPGSPTVMAVNNPNSVAFLYGDNGYRGNFVLAPNWNSEYSTVGGGPDGKIHILVNSERHTIVDLATCVLVFYSVSQARFVRLDWIPAGLLRGSGFVDSPYQPTRWLRPVSELRPRAVVDFFSHDSGMIFKVSPEKRLQSAGLLTIDTPLADHVFADSLTPYVLELQGKEQGYSMWLGSGRAQGYSSLVWAREATAATLKVRVGPGSSKPSPERLVVSVARMDGHRQLITRPFNSDGVLYDLDVNLSVGRNIVEIWLEGTNDPLVPQEPDQQRMSGRLNQMLIYLTRTGHR